MTAKSFFHIEPNQAKACAAALGVVGAILGGAAGLHPSPDWRNEAFGPLCGFFFWGAAGFYLGALIDKSLSATARLVRQFF
jgi:hypothetical protein